MLIGEGFAGEGVNNAHVNVVLGRRDGPVGSAWAAGLSNPSIGHAAFVAVARPNIAVVPPTLFVNKAAIRDDRHGTLTWGAAQAGVAKGVGEALAGGLIDRAAVDDLVLIAAVWVNPDADSAEMVYANNVEATRVAFRRASEPSDVDEFLDAAGAPFNPFFTPAAPT
jgi:5,6,7,8-tetrahydromethanopterin hydro-lyase